MDQTTQYTYVDASWQVVTKHRTLFEPWQRIQVSEIEQKIIKPSGNHNCFVSVQRYREATSTRDRSVPSEDMQVMSEYQSHFCGLYFDFDAKPENGEELAFAIARAQIDANKLTEFFLTRFEDINPAHVQCWFSGGKGFHVLVRPEVFNIKPHTHLTYMIKNMAWALAEQLDMPTLDKSVYTISRLWRIPNSVHQKTNLRKVELSVNELAQKSATEIMAMAKQPRLDPVWSDDEYDTIAALPDATAWWDEWEHYFGWQQSMAKSFPRKKVTRPDDEDGLPACMQDITENGPRDDGKKRNHVAMVMATYWKDMGYSMQQCAEEIDHWTHRHFGHRDQREVRENIANGRSAVRSVYSDDKYAFTCNAIRACGNISGPNPIACSGDACKWIKNPSDQEPASEPTVHLSEASRGIYDGRRLRIPVHISGKQEAPYLIPLKGTITCPEDNEKRCPACPHKGKLENEVEWTLSAKDRDVLRLIDVNDNIRKGAIKTHCKYPQDCYKAKVAFTTISNIEGLRLVPMVDHAQDYQEDAINQDEIVQKSSQHAVRDGYFIGHGIQANKKYNLISYTFSHPKDQRAVHIFEEATPHRNDIEHFKLTDDMKNQLKIFQPREGESVADKMYDIHQDLCINVHQIGGLQHMAQAVDLCFHSVIGFYFKTLLIEKGWFELLVVGDSSMGKSTMVKRLIQHFRVGEMIAGEEARRTGLVWASVQINNKWTLIWGKIPQNDRRLLVIDEFGEMDQEEVGKLTQLRSEGRARGQGVSSDYETWARTRLILLTNVRGRRDLSSYPYGVQAVASIFKVPADLRRTDLAVAVKKGEVSPAVANKDYSITDVRHIYTSDLCHNLILWAWSRSPKHIEFVDGAEQLILDRAQELGERYDSDLYLVETNDMRHKVARVSCAVAARVFSTDERCVKLIVKPEHVEYAVNLFDRCYGKANPGSTMRYHSYAKGYQRKNVLGPEKRERIEAMFNGFGANRDTVMWALIDMQDFRKADLSDQLAMPKEEFDPFWKFLRQENLVVRKAGIYRKTGPFNDHLNSMAHNLDTSFGEKPPF